MGSSEEVTKAAEVATGLAEQGSVSDPVSPGVVLGINVPEFSVDSAGVDVGFELAGVSSKVHLAKEPILVGDENKSDKDQSEMTEYVVTEAEKSKSQGLLKPSQQPLSYATIVQSTSKLSKHGTEEERDLIGSAATVIANDSPPAEGYIAGPTELHTSTKSPTPSLPSLGAWATPLNNYLPSIPFRREVSSKLPPNLSSLELWPPLSAGQQVPTSKQTHGEGPNRAKLVTNKVITKNPIVPKPIVDEIFSPEVKEDGKLRFPWAAKMDPSLKNLYRTSTTTYLEDGTPKVTIPSHILLHGPENQKEYIIGQFYRCSTPSGGLINAVVNKIWGRNCKIFSRKLGESSYLFHIPDASTCFWVLQRGMWEQRSANRFWIVKKNNFNMLDH